MLTQLVKQEPYEPEVTTFKQVVELIRSKDAILNLVTPNGINDQIIMHESEFAELRRALDGNPPIYLDGRLPAEQEKLDQLEVNNNVISVNTETGVRDSMTLTNCDFVVVYTGVDYLDGLILSPEINQSTISRMNQAITDNYAYISHILESDQRKRLEYYDKCRRHLHKKQSTPAGSPIRLMRLSGAFAMFAGGVMISIGILVYELIRTVPFKVNKRFRARLRRRTSATNDESADPDTKGKVP